MNDLLWARANRLAQFPYVSLLISESSVLGSVSAGSSRSPFSESSCESSVSAALAFFSSFRCRFSSAFRFFCLSRCSFANVFLFFVMVAPWA